MSNKVFVCVPAFGQTITATTFLCTHALQMKLAQKGVGAGITTLSFPDIAELRSMFVTIWYDTMPDISHLLFIDADMGFDPQLVLDMLSFGQPVVGTIYPQRKQPLSWAGSGTGSNTTERRGDFMLVEGVGMGCTLIHREAIRIMIERYPELVDTRLDLHTAGQMIRNTGATRLLRLFEKMDIPDRGIVSEDLSFCIRWGQCGGQVWANIGYRMSHVGPFDFAARYLDMVEQRAQEANAMASEQAKEVDPVFTPLNAESVPLPGGGEEMPGGPEYRAKMAEHAMREAEAAQRARQLADIESPSIVPDYPNEVFDTEEDHAKHAQLNVLRNNEAGLAALKSGGPFEGMPDAQVTGKWDAEIPVSAKSNGAEPVKKKRGRPPKNRAETNLPA